MKTEFCKEFIMDFSTWEIVEHFGVINTYKNGWSKEINLVSWHGGDARLDIREWSQDHTQMSKGLTLSIDEFNTLKELIKDITI